MTKRDYYEVLGVGRDAEPGVLKSAYRKLALQFHPDRNPGDSAAEEKFKEASEAYAILSDPDKRRAYDHLGFAGVGTGAGAPGFDFGDLGGFGDIFNDLFGDLFGGRPGSGRGRGRGQRGADLRYNLEIELQDVRRGLEAQIEIPKTRPCGTCSGSGARAGTHPETCRRCHGAGQVVLQQGFFRISRPCEECGGAGEIVRERCGDCRGSGRTQSIQRVKVKVPPGVEDGVRLRLAGEGEAGIAGGSPGDLYVVVSVKPHALFERDSQDLHCQVPITFVQAALGAEVEVPSLDEKVKLKIPEGTQSGKVLRLRGRGLPSLRSKALGDLHVHVFVEVPTRLTRRQRELLEKFAEQAGEEISPVRQGFLEKLRELFG